MEAVKRAAVYCRVSTDSADQAHSLENQRRYFEEHLQRSDEYELWAIYADQGITGTSARKRREFMRMIADAERGLFDVVLTKEISRFARNTLDSIYYTRLLKSWGIGVIFLVDSINTLEPDAELRLTILSSIAQEESRKISERIQWGQLRSMERGVVFGRDLLGYRVREGALELEPEGAETVRQIFYQYVEEGKGAYAIAAELERRGRRTARGGTKWTAMAVLRILRNEKYAGDLVQKKTYTPNYLDHKKQANPGERIVLPNHHQAIVPRELFLAAQRQLERRSQTRGGRSSAKRSLSGKVFCARCGAVCVARRKKKRDGTCYLAWKCRRSLAGEGCSCPQIGEAILLEAVRQAYAALPLDREALLEAVLKQLPEGPSRREEQRKRAMAENLKSLFILGYLEQAELEERWRALHLGERREPETLADQRERAEAVARRLLFAEETDAVFLGSITDRIETDGRAVTALQILGRAEI